MNLAGQFPVAADEFRHLHIRHRIGNDEQRVISIKAILVADAKS